jgi:hypothetical protein
VRLKPCIYPKPIKFYGDKTLLTYGCHYDVLILIYKPGCQLFVFLHNNMDFKLTSQYSPTGDQPEAIRQLVEGVNNGDPYQTLLGVTGSGKTFTMPT